MFIFSKKSIPLLLYTGFLTTRVIKVKYTNPKKHLLSPIISMILFFWYWIKAWLEMTMSKKLYYLALTLTFLLLNVMQVDGDLWQKVSSNYCKKNKTVLQRICYSHWANGARNGVICIGQGGVFNHWQLKKRELLLPLSFLITKPLKLDLSIED